MGDVACDESERPLSQTKKGRIRIALRIIQKLVHFHSSIVGNAERRAISECNAERAIHSGLNHVAAIDQITDLRLTAAARRQISLNNDRNRMFDAGGSRRI